MRHLRTSWVVAALVALTPFLTGCGIHVTPAASTGSSGPPAAANPVERQGTIPESAATQSPPARPAGNPQQAVEWFAVGYMNWTWRTLAADQERLAASAVGEARASELQARQQTARDTPLRRGHITNSGVIVAVAPARGQGAGAWVIDTREQTGGDGEYSEIRPELHIMFAKVQPVAGGFAVSSWRPAR